MKDLIELLSDFPEINPSNYGDDEVNALNAWGIAAHTALEQQATEIERLKKRDDLLSSATDKLRISTSAEIRGYIAERDAALAKLSAMENQGPVAWMHPSGGVLQRFSCGMERETYTIPLYTAPKVIPLINQLQERIMHEN